jgi:hypothetical protein
MTPAEHDIMVRKIEALRRQQTEHTDTLRKHVLAASPDNEYMNEVASECRDEMAKEANLREEQVAALLRLVGFLDARSQAAEARACLGEIQRIEQG